MESEGSSGRPRVVRHVAVTENIGEKAVWQMNVKLSEFMEAGPYPERAGEPDCTHYIRTGICSFGKNCRYNHPPDRKLALAARIKEVYPDRVGQPECQFYLKTGTCQFGATCKFHHPKDKAARLNIFGYPLHPSEKECAYYLRTGRCKFGGNCKFHHPSPSNFPVPFHGSNVYPSMTPGQHSYPGGLTNLSLSRASYIPSPQWQSSSSYAQQIHPEGLVQVPGWNAYTTQLAAVSSSEGGQQTLGTARFYSVSRPSETAGGGPQGILSSYQSGSIPLGFHALPRESIFPERPDQPECQFYMKTGDCKFGAVCRFHHPKERSIPAPNCLLSPLGLPLRPGEPVCSYYSRYGICKFGPICMYHHPLRTLADSLPASSSTEAPVVQHLLGSSSRTASRKEGPAEPGSGKTRGLSGDENVAEGSHSSCPSPSFS